MEVAACRRRWDHRFEVLATSVNHRLRPRSDSGGSSRRCCLSGVFESDVGETHSRDARRSRRHAQSASLGFELRHLRELTLEELAAPPRLPDDPPCGVGTDFEKLLHSGALAGSLRSEDPPPPPLGCSVEGRDLELDLLPTRWWKFRLSSV